jgi:hypothetical protein
LHRKIGRLLAPKDTVDVGCCSGVLVQAADSTS